MLLLKLEAQVVEVNKYMAVIILQDLEHLVIHPLQIHLKGIQVEMVD